MDKEWVSTRRELIKLTAAGATAGLASLINESPKCQDIDLYLEEGDLQTSLGTQYELNMNGAEGKAELYENGEKIDEYRPGETFILTPGEYQFKTDINGCTYTEEVKVE